MMEKKFHAERIKEKNLAHTDPKYENKNAF